MPAQQPDCIEPADQALNEPGRKDPGSEFPKPPCRRLRVYAFDPSLATQLETAVINQVTLKIRWEGGLQKGPVGEYLEVVDVDPASDCYYAPVNLNDPHLLAQDGLAPSEGDPYFHQQMVYAVAMAAIASFERALGRLALWAPHFWRDARKKLHDQYVPRLRIYPHALRQANAYYSPQKKALLFGYFPADASNPAGHLAGSMVFTCLSHDVVVHETTHALLDGLHRRFIEPTNADSLAFHEAFSDICALFQHFSFPEVLEHQIGRTRGELDQQNLLGELAQQFGRSTGARGALRSAIGETDPETGEWRPLKADPSAYRAATEPHKRGSFLVAAVFDAFLSIYKSRVADLLRIASNGTGILPQGQLHPDLVKRLAREAAKSAQHVLNICIRALDYCPPMDLTFGEYLRAIITADYDLVRDDDLGYRVAFIEAFRQHGIYPDDVRTLSEQSLRWNEPQGTERELLSHAMPPVEAFLKMMPNWDMTSDREVVYKQLKQFQAEFHEYLRESMHHVPEAFSESMGIDPHLDNGRFSVESLRPARRIGPDGQQIVELIVEITQRAPCRFREGKVVMERTWLSGHAKDADMWFRGGCTLLIDPRSACVRYVIRKHINSRRRLERQAGFVQRRGGSLKATYFGASSRIEETEAFAMLHRNGPLENDDG